MFRSKYGEKNTYNMPDKYNAIDWALKSKYNDLVEYVKALIALRKAHPAFALQTAERVREHLSFIEHESAAAVGFVLDKLEGIDSAKRIVVLMNGSREEAEFAIPEGSYKWISDGKSWWLDGGEAVEAEGKLAVEPISAVIIAEF
jgi:pullulanase